MPLGDQGEGSSVQPRSIEPHPLSLAHKGAPVPPPRGGRVGSELRAAALRIDRLDAEVLLAHLLDTPRLSLLLDPERAIDATAFAALVDRRAAHEPVAYIAGVREFWSLDLHVAPGVLIPRPDSETLIEAAIRHFRDRSPATILDLGTGSGALLLAALSQWPAAIGVGIDASLAALAVAAANTTRLGFGDRARILAGGWEGTGAAFDIVLCNPPYVESGAELAPDVRDWEPAQALFAGADGLDAYRVLAPLLGAQIAEGGVACIEIGSGQGVTAAALFEAEGLSVRLERDLAGLPRCLVVTK